MNVANKLSESLSSGFIDYNLVSLEKYNPKLLVNDFRRGMKVLSSIEEELRKCQEFYFSVAFITNSGITSLLSVLDELNKKDVKGKIITSQYQNFTEPKALKRLLQFKNIELRIVTEGNFHAKGYIFKRSDSFSFIIGSSNLTQNALGLNKEWNLKLSSLENGSVMQNILKEFQHTFDNATVVDSNWIDQYSKVYSAIRAAEKKHLDAVNHPGSPIIYTKKINPNKMQSDALQALEMLRNDGRDKALLVSATGTGKTYLSAFDVSKYQPKKFLFVVHRENIANAALRSYKAILGQHIDCGLLTGNTANYDKDYIFATIQTLSKDQNLTRFSRNYFDYIVIDEAHRAGANSYQKLLDYFQPKFLLGMSATPERTDGYDIFKRFDYNIAYEIRLNKAMEENMVSPFHYFGVSEIVVDGKTLDDNADFNRLISSERVERIIEAAQFYGWDSGRVKGLIFCSKIEEAKELSNQFNQRGFHTIALDGSSSEDAREKAIRRLEQEEAQDKLDYIFTVDIFNEGVDIPSVNQIIMLRPTQSAIVFVQQLGRGLRKTPGKEFLTVIDFIGNYSNNYLVPIALYGDRSFNKDTVRKVINSGSSIVPGCSTIHFDAIAKERIYKSIDSTKLNSLSQLKKDYFLLKYQLGKVPMMMDFVEHGQREPYAFVQECRSYYNFLSRVEAGYKEKLSEASRKLLEFYSKEILDGTRVEDAVMLRLLVSKFETTSAEIRQIIVKNFNYSPTNETLLHTVKLLNGSFFKSSISDNYGVSEKITMINTDGQIRFKMCTQYAKMLQHELEPFLDDMIKYAFAKFKQTYNKETFRNGFILYEKYSRKDACRILNWDKNEESTIYGYRVKHNTCPIFVTYQKNDEISDSTKYEDYFINTTCFSWMTKNRKTLESSEVQSIMSYLETGLRIPLFIKKSDGEGADFYYMGDVEPGKAIPTHMKIKDGKDLPVVNILFNMKDEVEESIYQYFESKPYTEEQTAHS